jgi:hypothetical protein
MVLTQLIINIVSVYRGGGKPVQIDFCSCGVSVEKRADQIDTTQQI